MKLTPLIFRRLFSRPFSLTSSPSAIRNVSGLAAAWIATAKPGFLNQEQKLDSSDTLYRKIWPASRESSITPFLDQWENEGYYVNKHILVYNAKRLRKCGRFRHALEVLHWMGNKGSMDLSAGDIAIQLDLMSKLHGCEQADKVFNHLPKELKNHQTYGALLNCYVHEMLVDKAEAMMQEMRDLGFFKTYLCYSAMLSLYYKLGNIAKLHDLEQEMDRLGIMPDEVIYGILLSAYGRESDVDGMNNIIEKAESDYRVNMDSTFYCNAANLYFRAGLMDKGVRCLKKAEIFPTSKNNNNRDLRLCHLLTLYAGAGMKEEVLRIWEKCKNHKIYNSDYYICMMTSLLKFNDFEAAEQILKEYGESTDLSFFDMRIPHLLIGDYCRNGLVEKAENVINRKILSKGLQPESFAWYYLSQAYIEKNRMPEAVEAMKSATLTCTLRWKPSLESLVACFSYLIAEKDMEAVEELEGLLKSKGFVSEELHLKLLKLALDGKQVEDELEEEFGARDAESEDEKNTCE